MAKIEDDKVDCKEKKLIDFVFEKWEQNTTCSYDFVPEKGNIENLGNYKERALQRFSDYVNNGYPFSMQRDAVELLSIRFSFHNMHAFLHDLREIANADGIFSEEEQNLIQLVREIWNIPESTGPEKPSENDRKLKYSNYCNFFRLKREAELSDLLRTAFQVDALAPLVQNFEKTTSLDIFSQRLNIGLEVGDLFAPRLEKLLKEVCEKLEIEEEFELLLCNEPSPNAMIHASISPHGKNLLVISSALVRSFSDDEIRFVLGHEISHWIFNANEITSLLVESYDEKSGRYPSLNLKYLISTWEKCAELSADRIGLVCCGSLEVAINALFRVCSGLDPENVDFDWNNYLNSLEDTHLTPREVEGLRELSHPPLKVRAKALSAFFRSELYQRWKNMGELLLNDKELAAKMDPLVDLLDFTSTDPIHSKRLLAITLGGFLLAQIDDDISPKEVDRIREILLNFIMHPDLVIDYAVQLIEGGENLNMLLQGLLVDLMDADENEKYPLMDVFIQIALSDGLLHRNETQILLDISSFLGIDRSSLLKELAIQLGGGNFFENQVPRRVNEILGRSDPFYLGDIEKRIEEAQNPAIDHESIVQLSQDADPQVRALLFFNESTPEDVRLQMLDSPSCNHVLTALRQEQEANQEDG